MAFLFATAFVGARLGLAQAWTLVFIAGASSTGVYLVLTPLALFEKFRTAILFSRMTRRVIILVIAYAPMIAGIAYWIQQAGTVEALPIFPAFIIIFYTWILLQAYFIATPVSQLLVKVERGLTGEGHTKKLMRTLGISVLFLPIAPLTYGLWAISNWLSLTYRNVQGATDKIIIWTMIITVLLLATYFFTALWGWRVIVQKKPQAVCHWRDADIRKKDRYPRRPKMEPSSTLLSVRVRLGLCCRTVLLHTPSPHNQNRSLNHCQRYSVCGGDLYHDVPDKKTPCISGVECVQGENDRPEP